MFEAVQHRADLHFELQQQDDELFPYYRVKGQKGLQILVYYLSLKLITTNFVMEQQRMQKFLEGLRWSNTAWIPLALALLGGTSAAHAEEKAYRFEISPFFAYRDGGQFEDLDSDIKLKAKESEAYGIVLNMTAKKGGQSELLYTRQRTEIDTIAASGEVVPLDLDVDYLQLGGNYLFDGDNIRPFFGMTMGLSRFNPKSEGFNAENFLSASFGGGWMFNATRRFGLRIEGRVYTSLVDSNSDIFCKTSADESGCLIRVEGTLFTQWEARAGLTVRF